MWFDIDWTDPMTYILLVFILMWSYIFYIDKRRHHNKKDPK